ncbi:CPBP family intramembrane metalloprotease [Candidatus Saccharibacteria bacterium]|nr:CPBP family intramembrane metalloprotease [Candidatus Saccharibacteria bacterium]
MAEKMVAKKVKKNSKGAGSAKNTGAKKHPWRLAFSVVAMLVWVGASVIVSQLAVGYLMIWIIGAEEFGKPVSTAIFSALSYVVAMLLIIIVPWLMARRRSKKKGLPAEGKEAELRTLGLFGWPTWTDVGLAPVGFIVYALLAGGIVALFSLFPWFDAEEVQEVGFSYYVSGGDRVLAFLTLVVVAPIAEEIVFRGWLYGKMREKIASEYSNKVSMVMSILLVSLLFGAVHGQWNVGVNVFAMSVVLCGLREITGTIYAGILLHMLKNGVAFWMLYMMGMG